MAIWLYGYVRPQRVWFFSRLGLNWPFWFQIGYGVCTLVLNWVCFEKLHFHHYRCEHQLSWGTNYRADFEHGCQARNRVSSLWSCHK